MHRIYERFYSGRVGAALLLLRLVVGLAFVFHGWGKVTNIGGFASAMHLPWVLAAMAAFSEFGGGIMLMLGLLTPLAALAICIVMLTALFMVHIPHGDPFVSANPAQHSFEVAAVYLVSAVAFLLTGPGAYSVDAWLLRQLRLDGAEKPTAGRRRGMA
jgi:putative oxidoreductase